MTRYVPLLLLFGCALEPPTDTPISPPPTYRQWWHEVETCVGRQGDFDLVEWYEADLSDRGLSGVSYGRKVFIEPRFRDHPTVVKHEMFHVLGGDRGHRDPHWKTCHLTWGS
jgi:hypothetical protein